MTKEQKGHLLLKIALSRLNPHQKAVLSALVGKHPQTVTAPKICKITQTTRPTVLKASDVLSGYGLLIVKRETRNYTSREFVIPRILQLGDALKGEPLFVELEDEPEGENNPFSEKLRVENVGAFGAGDCKGVGGPLAEAVRYAHSVAEVIVRRALEEQAEAMKGASDEG